MFERPADTAGCDASEHGPRLTARFSDAEVARAVRLFRALSDEPRLRVLELLAQGERCVSAIAEATNDDPSTVSHRLRLLHSEHLVQRRRQGRTSCIAWPTTTSSGSFATRSSTSATNTDSTEEGTMACNKHDHDHGPECGHTAIKHGDHVCYLHDGHLHRPHGDHVDECRIEVNETNPDDCTSGHVCSGHDANHKHGPGCGHEAVPHGDHIDYLVDGHLHHPCGDHCCDHGLVELV